MKAQRQKVEIVVYSISTFLTVAGTALCLGGLLIPNWYNVMILDEQQFMVEAKLGLWQDEICLENVTCASYWLASSNYSRSVLMDFPYWKMIQVIETAGTAVAVLSLLVLVPLWVYRGSYNRCLRYLSFSVYFASSMIAAFLCVIGCLIITSKGKQDLVSFAPLLSGIGGAVIFISVCLSCVVCRYDPTYGTLENPVSPKFSRA